MTRAWSLALAVLVLLPASARAEGDAARGEATYQKYCSQCHGATGMADGKAAPFVYPRPRPFKDNPTYKFRTTASSELPTDQDLFDIITRGIPGTSMPDFEVLSEEERWDLVAVIKSLSPDFSDPTYTASAVAMPELDGADPVASSDDSIAKGKAIWQQVECWKCHGQAGRGDGPSWVNLPDDSWGEKTWPRNLANPEHFRNGAEPADLFRTLTTGLNGTPMASFADSITPEDRWHLVNYVRTLGPTNLAPQQDAVVARRRDTVPETTDDPAWDELPTSRFPVISNVIEPPRLYWPSVDFVLVRAFYDDDEIALQVHWDDRSESKGADIATVYSDRDGTVYKGTQHPDQFAVQFPAKVEKDKRPYFLMGDNKRAVNLWWWTGNDGKLQEITAKGYGAFTLQPVESQQVKTEIKHADGRYTMVVRRSLTTDEARTDTQFVAGAWVPIAFNAWDGDSGELGQRRGLTTWYWLYLEPPADMPLYAGKAAAAGILTLALLGLVVVRTRKKAARP